MIPILLVVAGIALGRVWRSRADFEERLAVLEAEADARALTERLEPETSPAPR
jgi:hypothetical protein